MGVTMRFLFVLLLLAVPVRAQRTVALTFDDLPYLGASLEDATRATEALLTALAAHEASASAFVTGARVEVEGEHAARLDLLRRWRDAGHALENHSYSHLSFNETAPDAYVADVARGQRIVDALLAERPNARTGRLFRAPYNQTGPSDSARAVLLGALEASGITLAPFTVEHSDWVFNAVYERALTRGDTAQARRIATAYVAQLDTAFAFAERLSERTFGREIPQVFLLHANRLNADVLPRMLTRLVARGYRFVTMETALEDPAYATPDPHPTRWGISWLHRWRRSLGQPNLLREEPDPPAWIMDAHAALTTP